MIVPALIEYPTSIWFCLLEDDKYIKVAEVAGGVTELAGYKPKSLKQVRDRSRMAPRLLCTGRLAEETVKATGQWPALLHLMAHQIEKARKCYPRKKADQAEFEQAMMEMMATPVIDFWGNVHE